MKITKAKLLGIGIGLSLGAIVGGMILGDNGDLVFVFVRVYQIVLTLVMVWVMAEDR